MEVEEIGEKVLKKQNAPRWGILTCVCPFTRPALSQLSYGCVDVSMYV
jgi:hypothetical protein